MATTCFDDEIWEDPRYRSLKPSQQRSLPPLIVRLAKYGDGRLTVDECRIGLPVGKKLYGEMLVKLIDMDWLFVDDEGRVHRRGILAPHTDELEMQLAPDAAHKRDDAVRKRVDRAIEGLEARLDARFARIEAALNVGQNGTTHFEKPDISPNKSGQVADTLAGASNSNIESNRSNDSFKNSNIESIEPAPPQLTIANQPQRFDVEQSLKKLDFTDLQICEVLASYPVSKIVLGIDYLESGGWPNSKKPVSTMYTYLRGNLRIPDNWLDKREAAAVQTSAIMSVDGGRASPPDPSAPRKTAEEREADRIAAEEAKRAGLNIGRAGIQRAAAGA